MISKKLFILAEALCITVVINAGSVFIGHGAAAPMEADMLSAGTILDGGHYTGERKNGLRNGVGVMLYPDGSEYSGEWKNNLRHGNGVCILADGSCYQGLFINDKPHGKGVYEYPDGTIRSAVFASGKIIESNRLPFDKKNGVCRYGVYYGDGKYKGWYKGSGSVGYRPHGRGQMTWPDGCMYAGQWEDGKMHGRGVMRWEDGSVYMGQWDHGKRTGCGIYMWSSGSKYIGDWKDNQRHGYGISFLAGGGMLKGKFFEDRYIEDK